VKQAPRGGSGRTFLLRPLLVALLLGAAGYAVAGLVPGSGGRLGRADIGWILTGVGCELLSLIGYTALFHGVFSSGQEGVSLTRSAQIALGELGAYTLVPTGAGGPALRLWALLAGGMRFWTVMVLTVVHAVVFNVPYMLAAVALGIGVLLGVGPGHAPALVAAAPLGVVAVTVALAGAATFYARRHSSETPSDRWRRLGLEVVRAVPQGLRQVPGALRRPGLTLSALAYWAGDCGMLGCGLLAVGARAPLQVVVLGYMLGQLGNALPLPGGVGGVEPLLVGVLTSSGVNLGAAVAGVLLYRFVSLGLQAATGSVAAATLAPLLRHRPQSGL
jgi:uncharacterized membrane protein YbhN (UPF0104 family)